tara:strand:- start:22 stop:612 length:591 start_codon:yes stop_codon:yes gene_type:complete
MNGVFEGVQYNGLERLQEIDERIYSRNFSDNTAQVLFKHRPKSTKYSQYSDVFLENKNNTEINKYGNASVLNSNKSLLDRGKNNTDEKGMKHLSLSNTVEGLNPMEKPWNTYVANIDQESILKNQIRNVEHIPSSQSDLYNVFLPNTSGVGQPHPLLFRNETHTNQHQEVMGFGSDTFNNHTRQQLKLLGKAAQQG